MFQELYNVVNEFTFAISLITLALLSAIPICMWLSSFLRMYAIAKKLPGPSGHLVIGNMLELVEPDTVFASLIKRYQQYGSIIKYWFPNKLLVFMMDPADVKFAINNLKENHRPDHISKSVRILCGDGLLTMRDGDIYKNHKRILYPMFYPAMLKNFHLIFDEKSRSLCKKLSQIADGRTIDIFHYISSYTMEVICSTIIGCDVLSMQGGAQDFVEAIKEGDHMMPVVVAQPWLRIPWLQKLFASGRRLISTHKCINTFIERIVIERMSAASEERSRPDLGVAQEKREEDEAEGNRTREVPSMLDMIVSATQTGSDKFTVEDIRDELLSMINAGFMTTATSFAYLFVLLGIHQEVQEEVSRDLEEVFGSSLRPVTSEDLSRLDALERVIKETLRLFPAVPVVPREVSEDLHLPSGNVLPAGTNLFAFIYQLQRDPKSYEDPDSFIPNRWRPENAHHLNPDAFIPFGAGSRTCIGFRYAMLQMKVTCCNLLRQYKITTSCTMNDLTKLGVSITLHLYGGYNVQLHRKDLQQ